MRPLAVDHRDAIAEAGPGMLERVGQRDHPAADYGVDAAGRVDVLREAHLVP